MRPLVLSQRRIASKVSAPNAHPDQTIKNTTSIIARRMHDKEGMDVEDFFIRRRNADVSIVAS
jgi:hypothetical protein